VSIYTIQKFLLHTLERKFKFAFRPFDIGTPQIAVSFMSI